MEYSVTSEVVPGCKLVDDVWIYGTGGVCECDGAVVGREEEAGNESVESR